YAFAHRGVTGFRRIGAVLAIAGNPRVNQLRVFLAHLCRADTPLFQRAGAEILDHYVGLADQLLDQFNAAFAFQVERYRFLVAAKAAPPERGAAVIEFAPAADRVAAGRFDFYHFGAEVGEQGAGKRTSEQLAQFNHANRSEER